VRTREVIGVIGVVLRPQVLKLAGTQVKTHGDINWTAVLMDSSAIGDILIRKRNNLECAAPKVPPARSDRAGPRTCVMECGSNAVDVGREVSAISEILLRANLEYAVPKVPPASGTNWK